MSKERVVVGISIEDARRVVLAGDRRWSMVMAKYNFGKGGPCGSTGQWYTARYCANLEERLAVPCDQPLSKVGDWWSEGGFVLYGQRGHVVAELRLKAIRRSGGLLDRLV